jgi:hypothetical protein
LGVLSAAVYIGRFDFSALRGQAAYILAYLVVAVAAVIVLASAHRRPSATSDASVA